ncbi:hypothetical protein Cgig2_028808 [Carnegiea gigantea]|uniref:Uncharacterized protein n=1 Tax=Carnegiea gigantea TaxID=171969 RepID=A0A9Q1GS64_9CARY|nr:hypothetical protein Cgig2_028808 [Carnegiea gigantea]
MKILGSDIGLGGPESHDLMVLSQPIVFAEYKVRNVGDSEDKYPSTNVDSRCNEDDVVSNPSLEDEIPWQIDTVDVDDDGNPTFSLWNKIYQNGSMWTSYSWDVSELVAISKQNLTMDNLTMQNSIIQRHRIAVPTHIFKEYVEGKHGETYVRLPKCIEVIKETDPGTTAACITEGAKLHLLFWTTSNAYTKHVYKQTMDAIKRESKKAYEWLVDEPIEHWARFSFDPEVKCLNNTTNFVGSFNGTIEKYRYKPILITLAAVTRKFMQTIANRAKLANQWKGKVGPMVKLLLIKAEKESRGCILTLAS